jgi:hypothetical protein
MSRVSWKLERGDPQLQRASGPDDCNAMARVPPWGAAADGRE